MDTVPMRVTPVRASVILRGRLAKEAEGAVEEEKFTTDGYRVVDATTAFIPDPRLSTTGHCLAALYYYGGFLLAIAYVAALFATGTVSQTTSMPLMKDAQPSAVLQVAVACSSATSVQLSFNYTAYPASACYNGSSVPVLSGTVNAAQDIANPSAIDWTVLLPVPLCYVDSVPFSPFTNRPPLPGVMLYVADFPDSGLCVVDVFEGNVTTGPLLSRLNLENRVVKTFFMGHYQRKDKNNAMTVVEERLLPTYYELDGLRSSIGATLDRSSVINFRLTEVAHVAVDFDTRTVVTYTGQFSCLWWLLSFPLFWMVPLLVGCCGRNFLSDQREGRIDGYTRDLLARASVPTSYVNFGDNLIKKVKLAMGQV